MDAATREQLWKDPDWNCSACGWTNMAIREKCRNCGYVGGEIAISDVVFAEVSEPNNHGESVISKVRQ